MSPIHGYSVKEEIRQAADIVELISQYVQLKKRGRNYLGLCPFHSEKEPSFTVSPEKQIFHCFGCKKGGDIFAFWMAYHGTSFLEAVKDLAERYNIVFDDTYLSSREKEIARRRQLLFEVNERAAEYFCNTLAHNSIGEVARRYLSKRGISDELIEDYRLGYSPESWNGLTKYLDKAGLDLSVAASSGLLVAKKSGGYYDRFRGRIIFPIMNAKGQVVGFGGRALGDEMPKYLNTPESPIFHKGDVLYGLHISYKPIREAGRAVVVEGYMDLLALKGKGISEVVATLGTALTEQHVRRLKGYTSEIVVVFDSDEAGKKAVLNSLPIFINQGLMGKAVVLPDGHDPDSFVNQKGPQEFIRLLDSAYSMFDFYLYKIRTTGQAVEQQVNILKEMLPSLAQLKSYAMRAAYIRRLSEALGISEDSLWEELRAIQKKGPRGKAAGIRFDEKISSLKMAKRYNRDIHFLNLIVHHEEARNRLSKTEWPLLLSDPLIKKVVSALFQIGDKRGEKWVEKVLESLQDPEAEKELREILVMPSFYGPGGVETAIREFEEKIEEIKVASLIKEAKARGDMAALNEALKIKKARAARPYSN